MRHSCVEYRHKHSLYHDRFQALTKRLVRGRERLVIVTLLGEVGIVEGFGFLLRSARA